tara:strand:+ start:86810 stop:87652 length:843 start_codon:yes stop_codon:yes gene_type:complete
MKTYHYTSGEGLFGILNSSKLRLTNQNFLNDPSEISYANQLILETLKENKEINDIHSSLFNESALNTMIAPFDLYIASFSKNPDSLDMWNYYSKGNGYCIEFELNEFLKNNISIENLSLQTFDIIYNQEEQIEKIKKLITDFSDDSKEYEQLTINVQNVGEETEYYNLEYKRDQIILRFNEELWKLKMQLKNKAYEREQEVRIVASELKYERNTSEYRVNSSGLIIDFISLNFELEKTVKSISLHPLSGEIHHLGLSNFIQNKFKNKLSITKSKIPFREI